MSFMAVSEHKDVALPGNHVLSQYVVQLQTVLDKPHNLVVTRVPLEEINLPCFEHVHWTHAMKEELYSCDVAASLYNMLNNDHVRISQLCAGNLSYTDPRDQRGVCLGLLLPIAWLLVMNECLCLRPKHNFQLPEPDSSKWFHPSRGIDWSGGRG